MNRQLDEDVARGVIEPVPVSEAKEWCSRMVVVAKKSGQPRRTIDYQHLNAACRRETHQTPTPFDMVSSIPRHVYKTTADAHWGFHQVELEESSRKLTTFITPWGRYRFKRSPMGFVSSGDEFSWRLDNALDGIENCTKVVDDLLVRCITYEEHLERVKELSQERKGSDGLQTTSQIVMSHRGSRNGQD